MVIGGPDYSLFENYDFDYTIRDSSEKLINAHSQKSMFIMQSNQPEDWAFQSQNFLFGRLDNLKEATQLKPYSALLTVGF